MTLRLGDTLIAGSGANQDLSNLTSTGKNIANWSSNVTNCITEIPQDIKLELSNGTLMLKAGSKVYVPNGSGVFDTVTVASDVNCIVGGTFTEILTFYNPSTNTYYSCLKGDCHSGATAPTSLTGNTFWYDTTNNIIKRHNGASWDSGGWSLTICEISSASNLVTSIDQVFNGFGYIGSTEFMLPNVKCIETLGKNSDGSYITRVFTNTEVRTETLSGVYGNCWVGFNTTINGRADYFGTYSNENVISEIQPSYNNVSWFNPLDGKWNYVNNGLTQLGGVWQYAIKTLSDGKITNWKLINNTFKALNYWDKPTISGWSMPSSRYINLTLGASGATYTAPANGWFTINKHGIDGQLAAFDNSTAGNITWIASLGVGTDCRVSCPAKKGDNVTLWYNATGTTNFFRFVYAEGEA